MLWSISVAQQSALRAALCLQGSDRITLRTYITGGLTRLSKKTATQNRLCQDRAAETRMSLEQNSRWRTAAILNTVNSPCISEQPILIKYIAKWYRLPLRINHVIKIQNLKNSKWRNAILKICFVHICVAYCPICFKCCAIAVLQKQSEWLKNN